MSRLEHIRKMLQGEPEDVFLNFALAMEYLKAGKQQEALDQLARVRDLDPDYIPAYLQAGQALVALGQKEEAKNLLAQGIDTADRQGDRHAADQMREIVKLLA